MFMSIARRISGERGNDETYSITDLIDLEKLQHIQDTFAEANGVASTLTDVSGVQITRLSNHSKVCGLIRATEKGLKYCIFSGKALGREALEGRRIVHHKCAGIGFTDAAAPIIVNGRHIANWLIGQYHVGKVDDQRVREYALEIGANQEALLEAFTEMPKMSLQDFEKKLVFLDVMASELSLMGYQNLIWRQQNEELKSTKEELEKYQFQLESMVEKRTIALQQANRQLSGEITQKTKMQKRQNRLITAIESAAESIVITSTLGRIIYANPAFELLTGYSSRELIGKNPRVLKSGFHDEHFYRNLWQTILAGKVWSGRFANKKKDGTIYQEEATISPVKNAQGKIVNFVAVKKDITKEIELETQLHQAQKMESIGTLAAGMAHEINTPIQYLLSNTEFLKEVIDDFCEMQKTCETLVAAATVSGSFGEEIKAITQLAGELDLDYLKIEAHEAVEQSLQGIRRISGIVTAMKDFAQPGRVEKQREDLNRIIEVTVEVSRSQWQDIADIQLDLWADLPLVPLLSSRFKQIILDMIRNSTYSLAEKHNSCEQQKGLITITTRRVDNQVEMRLADTGTGIPQAIIDKIFDPFFTTKPVDKGSGQGLSVAHSLIVDQHGGTIRVSSVDGEGTEFIIALPLS